MYCIALPSLTTFNLHLATLKRKKVALDRGEKLQPKKGEI